MIFEFPFLYACKYTHKNGGTLHHPIIATKRKVSFMFKSGRVFFKGAAYHVLPVKMDLCSSAVATTNHRPITSKFKSAARDSISINYDITMKSCTIANRKNSRA